MRYSAFPVVFVLSTSFQYLIGVGSVCGVIQGIKVSTSLLNLDCSGNITE